MAAATSSTTTAQACWSEETARLAVVRPFPRAMLTCLLVLGSSPTEYYVYVHLQYGAVQLTRIPDDSRRSSAGAITSQPTPSIISPISAINRADLFHSLRPMASTESLNLSLTSKRTFLLFLPWGVLQEPGSSRSSLPPTLAHSTFSYAIRVVAPLSP